MRSREDDHRRGSPVRGLVVLNASLLAVLAAVTFGPAADAQQRSRGDYTMVAGGVNGAEAAAVYVVDTTNQEMMVVTYDHNTKQLDGIGFRSLAEDTATLLRGRGGG
jgi:hypothetical protein